MEMLLSKSFKCIHLLMLTVFISLVGEMGKASIVNTLTIAARRRLDLIK